MRHLLLTMLSDITESLRARWFMIYTAVFGGLVALLFVFGLSESRILGFMGLSRLLTTYIQLCMAILPIFVLITTVRSVAGDREAGVFEYLLSLRSASAPGTGASCWGGSCDLHAGVPGDARRRRLGDLSGHPGAVERVRLLHRSASDARLVFPRHRHAAVEHRPQRRRRAGAAFIVWLTLVLFLDIILLGALIKEQLPQRPRSCCRSPTRSRSSARPP